MYKSGGSCLPFAASNHRFCTSSSVLSSIFSAVYYTTALDSVGVGEAIYISVISMLPPESLD